MSRKHTKHTTIMDKIRRAKAERRARGEEALRRLGPSKLRFYTPGPDDDAVRMWDDDTPGPDDEVKILGGQFAQHLFSGMIGGQSFL